MARKKKPSTPAPPSRRKVIRLSEETQLNKKMIDELEELFLMVAPKTLHKSVHFIFFQYLFYADCDNYPPDFKHISEDFYFLMQFLEKCGEE